MLLLTSTFEGIESGLEMDENTDSVMSLGSELKIKSDSI